MIIIIINLRIMSPTLSSFFHPARSNLLARGARLCNHQSEWPIRIPAWVSDRIGARSWFISWVDRSIYSFDVMYEGCATVLQPGHAANVRVAENARAIRLETRISARSREHHDLIHLRRVVYFHGTNEKRRMINASLRNYLLLTPPPEPWTHPRSSTMRRVFIDEIRILFIVVKRRFRTKFEIACLLLRRFFYFLLFIGFKLYFVCPRL